MTESDIKYLGLTKSGNLARSLKLFKIYNPEKTNEVKELEEAVTQYYLDK